MQLSRHAVHAVPEHTTAKGERHAASVLRLRPSAMLHPHAASPAAATHPAGPAGPAFAGVAPAETSAAKYRHGHHAAR